MTSKLHSLLIPLLAMVATLCAVAASAAEPGQYLRCLATATTDGRPLSLVRTVSRNGGAFAFQASLGGSLMQSGNRNFRAYLAWPKSSSEPARLWIVHGIWENLESPYVASNSVMAFFGAGEDRDTTLAVQRDKNDFQIFEIDPQVLLRRFPDRQAVPFGVYIPGKKGMPGTHLQLKSTLDLEELRAELSQAAALAATLDTQSAACVENIPDLPREADIAQYTSCRVESQDTNGSYFAEPYRLSWQYRLSDNLYFFAERTVWGDESAEAFARTMEAPFASARPLKPVLRASNGKYRNRTDYRVELSAGDSRYEVPLSNDTNMDWQRMIRLQSAGVPIAVTVRDWRGQVVERGTLPAGIFSGVEAQLKAVMERVTVLLQDPIANCAPEPDIVVT